MIGAARLILQQAEAALDEGRLEEAHRLLALPEARHQRDASPLRKRLAHAFVQRGEQRFSLGESEPAWGDLLQAQQTGAASPEVERLRLALARRGLDQVRVLLAAGEPARAVDTVAGLIERGVRNQQTEQLAEAARNWLLAREQADRGDFSPAIAAIERARKIVPMPGSALEDFFQSLKQRQDIAASLLVPLYAAAEQGRWREVLSLSERMLAAAPDHKDARRLRTQAWKAVEPEAVTVAAAGPQPIRNPQSAIGNLAERFLLWVDGVGGYLVCMGARVTLGQALMDSAVDVPLLADVARNHAALVRDGEGYLLEPARAVKVNGEPVGRTLVTHGDRITLGATCEVLFQQVSAASTSARLDVRGGRRLPLALDGVLLMADALVLGPGSRAHVVLPGVREPVILFRHKDGLGVRCRSRLVVNGRPVTERGMVGVSGTVAGDDFRLTLEPAGSLLGRMM